MSTEQKDMSGGSVKNKPIRPILIASETVISDYPMLLEHLLAGLVDESIPVRLICPSNCDANCFEWPSVEVIRQPSFDLPFMGRYNRKILAGKLEKFKPTIIHCLCESKALFARQLSRQLGLPYVLTVNSLQNRFFRFLISSHRCAKIIVPAKSIADNLSKVYPKFAERIAQINMGTFVSDDQECFSDISRPTGIVMARRMDNAEDFEKVLGAIKHLAIDGHEFMLVMIGGGSAESAVRKLLKALGISQMVTIVPRLEPCRSILEVGDIFIRLGPDITFDPLLLEAMSVGSAIAGCKGGVDDLIIDEVTAVVFDPDDELSIYGSLQRLFSGRELARKLARSSKEYLREYHTVSKMVSSVLQTYREVQK